MSRRLDLHEIFVSILGSRNVYFQPRESIKMVYPAIVYERDDVDVSYADNGVYRQMKRYQVTVIDADPDSATPDKVGALPLCSFSRGFATTGLNHSIYSLYF